MLDFAVKLTEAPDKIEDADRDLLRQFGFSDRDIWDIAAVAAFFNMSNRTRKRRRYAAQRRVLRHGQDQA